jgi:hypothetical protein
MKFGAFLNYSKGLFFNCVGSLFWPSFFSFWLEGFYFKFDC